MSSVDCLDPDSRDTIVSSAFSSEVHGLWQTAGGVCSEGDRSRSSCAGAVSANESGVRETGGARLYKQAESRLVSAVNLAVGRGRCSDWPRRLLPHARSILCSASDIARYDDSKEARGVHKDLMWAAVIVDATVLAAHCPQHRQRLCQQIVSLDATAFLPQQGRAAPHSWAVLAQALAAAMGGLQSEAIAEILRMSEHPACDARFAVQAKLLYACTEMASHNTTLLKLREAHSKMLEVLIANDEYFCWGGAASVMLKVVRKPTVQQILGAADALKLFCMSYATETGNEGRCTVSVQGLCALLAAAAAVPTLGGAWMALSASACAGAQGPISTRLLSTPVMMQQLPQAAHEWRLAERCTQAASRSLLSAHEGMQVHEEAKWLELAEVMLAVQNQGLSQT